MKTDHKGADRFIKDKIAFENWRKTTIYEMTPEFLNCKLTCMELLQSVRNNNKDKK